MSYHVKSGKHLGVVRSWMQHSAVNGDQVTWGSNEQLKMRINLTPQVMEMLAQDIADAAVGEVLADVSNIKRRIDHALDSLSENGHFIFEHENLSSIVWDLTLAKSELAKMLEKKD